MLLLFFTTGQCPRNGASDVDGDVNGVAVAVDGVASVVNVVAAAVDGVAADVDGEASAVDGVVVDVDVVVDKYSFIRIKV